MRMIRQRILLFVSEQWVTKNKTMGNDEGAYVMLPLTFPTKCVTALLSDTYGRLSNSSAMANQTEGAKVNAVTINSVQIISYWSGGLNTDVTVLAIGYQTATVYTPMEIHPKAPSDLFPLSVVTVKLVIVIPVISYGITCTKL